MTRVFMGCPIAQSAVSWEDFPGAQTERRGLFLGRCLADLVRRYQTSRRRAGREQSLDELLDHSSQAMERMVAANGTSPSASAARRDLGVLLSDALAQLSEDHREVIVLHHLEGLDWDEVAQRLGRTAGAMRKLWTRALQQLRPLIDEPL
jgi:RNA polymerase sigma-70 factor (ECF subfamily)